MASFLYRISKTVIQVILLEVVFGACEKSDHYYSLLPESRMQDWLHSVNSLDKMNAFRYHYKGFELDVHFNSDSSCFFVKHDVEEPDTLPLWKLMKHLEQPDNFGLWFDFKNLDSSNLIPSLQEFLYLREAFHLRGLIIIESMNFSFLSLFDTLNFKASYYIPTFDPQTLTPEEEFYYVDLITKAVEVSKVSTISAYTMQHDFMMKHFRNMNKLLWYLDSTDPEIKRKIIKETAEDPTVEILLVRESGPIISFSVPPSGHAQCLQ